MNAKVYMYQETRVRTNLIILLMIITAAVTIGTIVISNLITELYPSISVFIKRKETEKVITSNKYQKKVPATFSLSPQTKSVYPGDTFEVMIKLNTNEADASVIQVNLSYSYDISLELEVMDADDDPANGVQIKPGRLKGLNYLTNKVTVDANLHRVTITLSAIVTNPTGSFKTKSDVVFGIITFKAISPVRSKTLSFNQEASQVVSMISSENLLDTPINGSYNVKW